ncbi:MAG: peptidoglycan DD-metalloendopeptidase family protein [Cyanobacteria bacterium P01_D01_bin.73]
MKGLGRPLTEKAARQRTGKRRLGLLLGAVLGILLWLGVGYGGLVDGWTINGLTAIASPETSLVSTSIPELQQQQRQLQQQQQQLQQQNQQLQEQRQQVDQQRQNLQEEGDRLQQQENQESKKLDALKGNLNQTERQLTQTEQRIEDATRQMGELEVALAMAEQTYQRKRLAIVGRLQFLQRQPPHWGFAVLLQSESLNEFLDRRKQIERVYERDRDQLKSLETAAAALSVQSLKLRDKQRDLDGLAQKLNTTAVALQAKAAQQREQVSELQAQRTTVEASEAQLTKDSDALTQLIREKSVAQNRLSAEQNRLAQIEQQKRQGQRGAKNSGRRASRSGRWRPASSSSGGPRTRFLNLGRGEMVAPASGPLTSGYGWRRHPILKRSRFHNGLDFGARYGSTIRAAHSGRVIMAKWFGGYGNTVIIDRGDGISTLYGHASELYVSNGQTVSAGQAIAAIGSTGLSTGPHLHFEVRINGKPTDPRPYL